MKQEVAEAVLEAYPGKKLSGAMARAIVHAWAQASGYEQDRWGNYHPREGLRIKLTKQRMQRQEKRGRDWRNLSSTPLISAAQNLVVKAAEARGDEEVHGKVSGAREQRRGAKEQRAEKALEEARKAQVESMAAKVVSAEDPGGFVAMYESGEPSPAFKSRYLELTKQIDHLQRSGRTPVDRDFFSTTSPPLAPILIESKADWLEEVDGVPYTVTLRHADQDRAVIEIGAIGTMGLTNRVDPITKAAVIDFEPREGDSYASGYVQRRKGQDPVALLFFIQSAQSRTGAGSRILDLWCNLMDAYGVDVWLAEAVGDEGMAFLNAKAGLGRLEILGKRGANLVVRCTGGYRGRQQSLALNPGNIFEFPHRPERVEVGSRSYALSDVGVPVKGLPDDPPEEEDDESARVIDMGGNRWRYIWVWEPASDRLDMYRFSDGEWKVFSTRSEFPETFAQLQRSGQLNTVTAEGLVEFEAAMRQRGDEALSALQEWWEEEKGDQQRLVDALVLRFYEEQVRPEVERAWEEIDRGVFPFDFSMRDFPESKEDQARMHVLHRVMERLGFTRKEDSELERFVLRSLGLSSWEDLDDQQSIEWAQGDVLDQRVYPTVKRGQRRRGYEA
jgi:hypothetical protein